MRRLAVIAWAGVLAGCLHDNRPQTERGGSDIFDSVQEIKSPPQDRCEKQGQSAVRGPCDDAKYIAETYVRHLSTGDEVCLEGGFGDAPGAACLARADVSDVGTNRLLLHLRDTKPQSRWYKWIGTEIWFEEGALVDLYLADRGY